MLSMNLYFAFFHMQVVEMRFHYDHDCIPAKYKDDMIAFIQSNVTNKNCTRRLPVSPILWLCCI